MAYNPTTGKWEDEDASVASHVTGLMSKNSKLMQGARTRGLQSGGRRGLLNSSIAVSAAENEAYKVALPIASQEAGQIHQRNLQGGQFEHERGQQGRQFEHETGLQTRGFEHETGMQTRDISSRERLQGRDIDSRERMQRLDISSREGMQAFDAEVRERISQLDRESQERISTMQVSAQERAAAANMAANFESAYAQMFSNIMNNPEIPRSVREQYVTHASRVRDSNLRLVEQMYNIDLNWGTPGTSGGATGLLPPPIRGGTA